MTAVLTLGDLLKSEANTGSREVIQSTSGVKIGQLIQHPIRKKYLVALSNEEHGQVLVQPNNCVIFWDNVDKEDVKAKKLTFEKLRKEGAEFGIKFISSETNTQPTTTSEATGVTTESGDSEVAIPEIASEGSR